MVLSCAKIYNYAKTVWLFSTTVPILIVLVVFFPGEWHSD